MINNKKVIALTPARGGSKGLPGKNIKDFLCKPLLTHSVQIAQASTFIDNIYVSTDCDEIAKIAKSAGLSAYRRSIMTIDNPTHAN